MHIILCLDYSPFTEKILTAMQSFISDINNCKISVIHVIDETLLSAGTGYEVQLMDKLKKDSEQLKNMAIKYLGANINYTEASGIPRVEIDELLTNSDYDVLAIGNRSRSMLGARLVGGLAEHLLRHSKKPVLVIQ